MGYWEERVPDGKHCFVHYAIGTDDVITAAFDRLKAGGSFVLLGIYHVEPQSSAYPYSFPSGTTPDHWRLGQYFSLTNDLRILVQLLPGAALSLRADVRRLGAIPIAAARAACREQPTGFLGRQRALDRARHFRLRAGQSQPLHEPVGISCTLRTQPASTLSPTKPTMFGTACFCASSSMMRPIDASRARSRTAFHHAAITAFPASASPCRRRWRIAGCARGRGRCEHRRRVSSPNRGLQSGLRRLRQFGAGRAHQSKRCGQT